MRRGFRNFIQISSVLLVAFLLWYFFPVFVAFLEGAALSIRRFWWVVLLIGLSVWAVWVLKKRNPL